MITELQPYVLPRVDLGVVLVTSFAELFLLAWLVGWGTRLKEPVLTIG